MRNLLLPNIFDSRLASTPGRFMDSLLTMPKRASEGWSYDEATNIVWLKMPDQGAALTVRIDK